MDVLSLSLSLSLSVCVSLCVCVRASMPRSVGVGARGWIVEGLTQPYARPYTVHCPPPPPGGGPNGSILLFDISVDPCEQSDLSLFQPAIVKSLQDRLHAYALTAVPSSFPLREGEAQCRCSSKSTCGLASNPSHFNGTWTPWCS